jgi:hypothetical protein
MVSREVNLFNCHLENFFHKRVFESAFLETSIGMGSFESECYPVIFFTLSSLIKNPKYSMTLWLEIAKILS